MKGLFKQKHNKMGYLIIGILVLFCILAYVTNSNIRQSYSSIFNVHKVVSLDGSNPYVVGSLSRIVFTLFKMLLPFTMVYFLTIIIFKIRKKYGDTIKGMLISLTMLILPLLIVPEETGFVLVSIIIIISVLLKLFQNHRKYLVWICLGGLGLSVIVIYLAKVKTIGTNYGYMENMSYMFQAYFPGVSNTAGIYEFEGTVAKPLQWWYEVYNAIPFKTTLFGKVYDRVVLEYCLFNGTIYQIIPCIAQSYYFWGIILAPIETIILLKISLHYSDKAIAERNMIRYGAYMIISLFAALTPCMYNTTIFFSRYVNTFLPMLMIGALFGDDDMSLIRENR